MQTAGAQVHVPLLLYFLVFGAASAQVGTNNVFVPMNKDHKLRAYLEAGGQVESRQVKCSNPAWGTWRANDGISWWPTNKLVSVPACPAPLGCIPPGAACCGTMYYFWPETEFCCAGGIGSCTLGTTCCGASYCCKPGATCSGGACVRPTATTTKATSSQTAACTIEVDIGKRDVLPVFPIDYQEIHATLPGTSTKVCLDNRELMNSMCRGEAPVFGWAVRADALTGVGPPGIKEAKGCSSNMMRLTYRPDLFSTNRPKMCPDGFCCKLSSSDGPLIDPCF